MVKRNILSSSLIIITLLILGIYISRERVYIQKKQNAIYKNLLRHAVKAVLGYAPDLGDKIGDVAFVKYQIAADRIHKFLRPRTP